MCTHECMHVSTYVHMYILNQFHSNFIYYADVNVHTVPPSLNLTLARSRLAFGPFRSSHAARMLVITWREYARQKLQCLRGTRFHISSCAARECFTYARIARERANQLEGEARTYIRNSFHASLVHLTSEGIWLSCLNKITHSYIHMAPFYCCIYAHNGSSYIAT